MFHQNIEAVLQAYLLLSTTNLLLHQIIPVIMKYFVRYFAIVMATKGPSLIFYMMRPLILLVFCFELLHFVGFLSKLHSSYGPVVRLWVGPSQLLVSVKDPTLVKEVLTKAEDKLALTGRTYNLACGRLGLFVSSFDKVCMSMQQNPFRLYSITFLLLLFCIDPFVLLTLFVCK